jgi:hypothetical protein
MSGKGFYLRPYFLIIRLISVSWQWLAGVYFFITILTVMGLVQIHCVLFFSVITNRVFGVPGSQVVAVLGIRLLEG